MCSLANQTGDTLRACDPMSPVDFLRWRKWRGQPIRSTHGVRSEGTEPAFRTGGRGVRISSLRRRVGRTSKLGPRARIGWRVVCAGCSVFLGGLEVRIRLPPAKSQERTCLVVHICTDGELPFATARNSYYCPPIQPLALPRLSAISAPCTSVIPTSPTCGTY
jgi:hypothetical protein